MAGDCRLIVDQLQFSRKEIPISESKKITFRNALDAVWTMEVSFYRPFGLRLKIPFRRRFQRAWVKLTCEKLRRRVYVEAKIQIASRGSTAVRTERVMRNFIERGTSSVHLEAIFEDVEDDILVIFVSGELKIYVNPNNYFHYKYGLNYLPEEPQLQIARLQIINELSADLLAALSQQEHTSDVVLRCRTEDVRAHKVVLSARSKTFSAMFQTKTDVVDITDMRPIILKALLEYIYGGNPTIPNCQDGFELVEASDCYDLPGLKRLSLYYLQSILSTNNALKILEFAETHDGMLKKKALDFISVDFDNLKKTQEWAAFQVENPQLANEVLLYIIGFVDDNDK